MAGAAPLYPPLDLDAVRAAVDAGRTVRVGVLPTGQFPDGTAGRVRSVGAPDTDGPEFIQVELVVGGAKDVLPFAPGDLSPVRRGQAAPEPLARKASPRTRRTPARATASAPALNVMLPVGSSPSAGFPTSPVQPDVPPTAAAALVPPRPRSRVGSTPGSSSAAVTSAAETAAAADAAPGGAGTADPAHTGATGVDAPVRTTRRRGDRARRQPVTVTLSTTEPDHTGWSVHVTVGTRTVVKPTPVHPAQAWTIVTGLGHPEVEQVVAGALAEHRQQAQERADRLAHELAQARADLAAYPDL